MKLLNRRPTDAMCIAAREKIGVSANAADHIFQAMYDAAPEIKVDMEPVAEMCFLAFGLAIMPIGDNCDNHKKGKKYYSSEQVAALQAEVDALKVVLKESQAKDRTQELLAERDKTILEQQAPSIEEFNELGGGEEHDPLERLRFFCSLAMNNQDWLDVEKFFNHIETQHEAALKAERIKTLEDAATGFDYIPWMNLLTVGDKLRRMANELKEQP